MTSEMERLKGHVIVFGYGRIGAVITQPEPSVRFEANDGVLLIAWSDTADLVALFQGAKERVRAGRSLF